MTKNEHFWKTKSLNQMTKAEWESLCDGCGKCCLHKLEDIDTGEISISNVSCSFLDETSCRCKDYNNRQENVDDCIQLDLKNLKTLQWLPSTCAYRLIDEGKSLYDWHHLISGSSETIHKKGMSVRDYAVNESKLKNVEEYILEWFNQNGTLF
ncbi:MAG: YcgN family cysteine cluster protein [Alphaproteobacteria bacterium]|nr:YcgN family cysteine cluster protein [Alphaproteobacteria bacterium]